ARAQRPRPAGLAAPLGTPGRGHDCLTTLRPRFAPLDVSASVVGSDGCPGTPGPDQVRLGPRVANSAAESTDTRTDGRSPRAGAQVRFYLDDLRAQQAPLGVERAAPFDLAGTTPTGTARPLHTSTIANGAHTLLTVVARRHGTTSHYVSRFTVVNGASPIATAADTQTPSPAQPSASATPSANPSKAPVPAPGPGSAATTRSGLAWRSGATD